MTFGDVSFTNHLFKLSNQVEKVDNQLFTLHMKMQTFKAFKIHVYII